MEEISLHDLRFKEMISAEEVQSMVRKMSQEMFDELKDENPVFLPVLNGAFRVASDISKNFHADCEFSFIKLASYSGTESSGKVNELIGINDDLTGRTVVILEDIIDTGLTVDKIWELLEKKNPKAIKLASLLLKPEIYKGSRKIDYLGREIVNNFVVGYGLDYDGLGRNLNSIYTKISD